MKQLKIFAWNMQRGSSIIPPNPAEAKMKAEARGALLARLCNEHDIGFITEPGNDLINAVTAPNATSGLLPNGYGFWNCSQKADGQQGSHDCKNLIYSNLKLVPVEVNHQAGKVDCYRWPAAGVLQTANEPTVLLVAFHATSGGAGWDNAKAIFDHLDDKPKDRHKSRLVLVGGDMNSNHSFFRMPNKNTHQSGAVLDGFAGEDFDYYEGCSAPDQDAYITFKLVSALALKADAGTLAEEGGADPPGYYYWHAMKWVRVSDHAPVRNVVEIGFSASDDALDPLG